MTLKKKTLKKHREKKTPFHAYLLGNRLNIYPFGIIQMTMTTYDLWNVKVLLLKLNSMNHCHWNFHTPLISFLGN
jgi:hypothetical protein